MNVGFLGLLQLIFIVLKLTDTITWSWWLVFTPFYVWLAIFVIIVSFVAYMDNKYPLWRWNGKL